MPTKTNPSVLLLKRIQSATLPIYLALENWTEQNRGRHGIHRTESSPEADPTPLPRPPAGCCARAGPPLTANPSLLPVLSSTEETAELTSSLPFPPATCTFLVEVSNENHTSLSAHSLSGPRTAFSPISCCVCLPGSFPRLSLQKVQSHLPSLKNLLGSGWAAGRRFRTPPTLPPPPLPCDDATEA